MLWSIRVHLWKTFGTHYSIKIIEKRFNVLFPNWILAMNLKGYECELLIETVISQKLRAVKPRFRIA